MSVTDKIVSDFKKNKIEFITSVPCKQLASVLTEIDISPEILHVPCNKEDEGIGLCAGAFMGGKRPAIIMQNTALGVVINSLVTLTQFYRMPLPMLISYRGEVGEPVACQVEMAVHTKALLEQLRIQTYHFHNEQDVSEFDAILKHCFMSNRPVAILTDVDAKIIVGIWGLESAYGVQKGNVETIEALATLAFDGRRQKFFEEQLIAALKILERGDISFGEMKGSWAGAMGHTQFIPTSYLEYAQDFNSDGRAEIWSSDPTDALASTAYYLNKHGWIRGQPWGLEVRLPENFNYHLIGKKKKKNPIDWSLLGVRMINGL